MKRAREELEIILLTINEIIKANKGNINFDEVKEKFLVEKSSEFKPPITEEELEEVFKKHDLILFKGEYQKFLRTSELNIKMYDTIRFFIGDEKKDTINAEKIKKELKQKVLNEFKKYNQEVTEEDKNELYERIFEEQYIKFQSVQIYGDIMLHYIKKLSDREDNGILAKYKTKQKIKEEIQFKLSSEENKLSRGLQKMLDCFDSVFDIVWDNYCSEEHTKKFLEEQEKNKPKELFSLIKETMEKIPQEFLREYSKKAREEQRRREEKDKETLKVITVTKGEPNFKNQAISIGENRKKFSNILRFEKEIKVIPVNGKQDKIGTNSDITNLREENEGEEI